MEIGDVFVINKADRPDAMKTERELRAVLSLAARDDGWDPPIVQTVATRGQGIDEVAEAVEAYRRFTDQEGAASRRRVFLCRQKVLELIRDRMAQQVVDEMDFGRSGPLGATNGQPGGGPLYSGGSHFRTFRTE